MVVIAFIGRVVDNLWECYQLAIEQIARRLPLSVRHHITTIFFWSSEHSRRAMKDSSRSLEPFLRRLSRISVIAKY